MPLIALDVGLSRPVAGKAFQEIIAQGQILSFSLDGSQQHAAVFSNSSSLKLPDGVVYSKRHDRLFITNMGVPTLNDGSVFSLRLDGSDPQIILQPGQVHTPKQLALDSVNDRLYISDREGLRVFRCNLDGSGLEVLVQTGDRENLADACDQAKWCVGIAVSPKTGIFYWTQKGPSKGGQGRVFCAPTVSPGPREPICLLDNLPEPIDLDIDEGENVLYWTDRGELPYGNTFNRVRLDTVGTQLAEERANPRTGLKHEILVQNLDEAIGLAFDPSGCRWFVSDMGGTIWSFDQAGGDRTVIFHDEERAFTGIALVK